ncbi:TlpA family protein disulfide reductase [Mucilaginibacter polytrichastri]|uniref:Thiol-disulfide oxidoreductase resA n=1 Tax=Mucilaginibacter polytrichastri TaxID=1302689 RepID=A0A1Q6A2P9_9SPHI|nr:TlpA disulfide reductase family protein [Mucilaginibacter polytrichastri]OKS88287.1 Thiol-disulfide oxidoreductase resA [Mucilaginibacter polytrichastri]SFT13394.1 Thiol-disulfide isomerase or thioredoxin [Mucilaginibacter polytrichastri]
MKKLTLLFTIAWFGILTTALAQQSNSKATAQPGRFHPPDENTIVKDSSGTVYPYVVWRKLLTSGDYNMRSYNIKPDSMIYIISQRSEQEKDAMMVAMPKPAESKQFVIGSVFNPFKEKDMAGEKLDLKKMPGKVIVLNFWFIGCPPCRAEIPDLNKLVDHYKDNPNVVFVAVALDEAYDLKDFLKTTPFKYHVIDNGRYIAGKYGVRLYPTNAIIDKDEKVAYSSEGGHMNNVYWMRKTIDAALAATEKTTAAQ